MAHTAEGNLTDSQDPCFLFEKLSQFTVTASYGRAAFAAFLNCLLRVPPWTPFVLTLAVRQAKPNTPGLTCLLSARQ